MKIFSIEAFGKWVFDEMYFQTLVSSEIIQSFQIFKLNKGFMFLIGIHEESYQLFILTNYEHRSMTPQCFLSGPPSPSFKPWTHTILKLYRSAVMGRHLVYLSNSCGCCFDWKSTQYHLFPLSLCIPFSLNTNKQLFFPTAIHRKWVFLNYQIKCLGG
jgi:hypothetical protein